MWQFYILHKYTRKLKIGPLGKPEKDNSLEKKVAKFLPIHTDIGTFEYGEIRCDNLIKLPSEEYVPSFV